MANLTPQPDLVAYASYYAKALDRKNKKAFRRSAGYTRPSVDRGYPRQPVRRMMGVPASMYPRIPTNATALKSLDVTLSGSIVSAATAVAVALPIPLIGAGFMNRLGNRTRGVSLQLTGFIGQTTTNGTNSSEQVARIIVLYDRQTNGALPAIGTIMGDTIAAGTTSVNGPLSGLNVNNRDRFMVLRDRKVLLPEVGGSGVTMDANVVTSTNDQGKGSLSYNEFIKLKGLETCYNTTAAGTISDISAGSFIVLAYCSDAAGNATWNFTCQARFKFLD